MDVYLEHLKDILEIVPSYSETTVNYCKYQDPISKKCVKSMPYNIYIYNILITNINVYYSVIYIYIYPSFGG